MRLPLTLATAAAILLSLGTVPAQAADGENLPPGAQQSAWDKYVTSVKKADAVQDWATPQGKLIADSGFRPFTDGFSFFNTGVPDIANHRLFGTPKTGPKNLDADTLREMMGEQVCVEGNAEGTCTLTLAGKMWRDSINANMAGGHCYGVATTAGQLFAGELAPAQFQAGATTTYDLGLRTPISRQIARNMASQYTKSPFEFLAKPSQVVTDLKAALTPGSVPPVLIMLSEEGGHAVTPYALYQGDDGRYDVAIYDNNYPDFQRVVRLDIKKEQAQYAFQVNPEATPEDPVLQEIGLVPADFITSTQPCPFCRDAEHTTIQIEPVMSKVPLKAKLTRLNGKPMKGLTVVPPTIPWEPGQPWNFPAFQVPKDKAFLVTINARNSTKKIDASVLATTGTYAIGTSAAKIPAGTIGRVGFDTKSGVVVYRSKDPGLGLLSFVDSGDKRSVSLAGRADSKAKSATIGGALVGKRQIAVLYPLDRKAGEVSAYAQLQFYRNGKARNLVATVSTALPADGALAISYARWSRSNPQGLKAFVVEGSTRTRVPVEFP